MPAAVGCDGSEEQPGVAATDVSDSLSGERDVGRRDGSRRTANMSTNIELVKISQPPPEPALFTVFTAAAKARALKEVEAEIGDADITVGELVDRVWAKLHSAR
jgi:hypothetical protein